MLNLLSIKISRFARNDKKRNCDKASKGGVREGVEKEIPKQSTYFKFLKCPPYEKGLEKTKKPVYNGVYTINIWNDLYGIISLSG